MDKRFNSFLKETLTNMSIDTLGEPGSATLLSNLKYLKLRCDNDEEFEDWFFNNVYDTLVDTYGDQLMIEVFLLQEKYEIKDEEIKVLEEVPYVQNNTTYNQANPKYRQDGDFVIVNTNWYEDIKLSVVGNSAEDIRGNYVSGTKEFEVVCNKQDVFIGKNVKHIISLPGLLDVEKSEFYVKDGVVTLHFQFKPTTLMTFLPKQK